jgi:hypothetical protein
MIQSQPRQTVHNTQTLKKKKKKNHKKMAGGVAQGEDLEIKPQYPKGRGRVFGKKSRIILLLNWQSILEATKKMKLLLDVLD